MQALGIFYVKKNSILFIIKSEYFVTLLYLVWLECGTGDVRYFKRDDKGKLLIMYFWMIFLRTVQCGWVYHLPVQEMQEITRFDPWVRKSPGGRNGNLLQKNSSLEKFHGQEEPVRLLSVEPQRVRHDWTQSIPNSVIHIYICLRLGYFGVVQRLANFLAAPESKCFTPFADLTVSITAALLLDLEGSRTICKQVVNPCSV